MLVTEEEAKTKVCPHITYCENPYQVAEGQAAQYRSSNCLASECMAWRVAHDDWSENAATGEKTFYMRGFCGLAGKP